MPSKWELTSVKTGQVYNAEFDDDDPPEGDLQSAIDQWDQDFYNEQGLDPSIAEQGPIGTASNAAARDLGGLALKSVGGVVKTAAETKRALGPVGDVVSAMPGIGAMMALGQTGDAVAEFTDKVSEESRAVFPTNPANPVAEAIGGGLGQAIGILGTAAASVPALGTRAAMTLVPAAIGGAMGMGEGIDTAKEIGIENPAGRLAMGAAFGGIEAATERLGGIGGKVASEALQQGVKQGLKQGGKSIISEAGEEMLSGTGQDVVTRAAGEMIGSEAPLPTLNPLDPEFINKRKLEAIGGAAGGTLFAGVQVVAGQGTSAVPSVESPVPLAEGEVLKSVRHPETGKSYDIAFTQEPTEEDIEAAVMHFGNEDVNGQDEPPAWTAPVPEPATVRAPEEVAAEFRQRAVLRPAAPLVGMEEHVSDLTEEDVADIEQANRFANPQDPSLSPEMKPGNLGDDVSPTRDYSEPEASGLLQAWGRTLPPTLLPAGRKLTPASADVLRGRAESLGFAKAFANLFGRRVVVFEGLGPEGPGGATNPDFPDTVFINGQSKRHWHSIAGHEMVHHLEVAQPALFKRLDATLRTQLVRQDLARENYRAYYEQGGDLNVRREIYADLMAESMSDPDFWRKMGQQEPGLFMPLARSVWNWFQAVVTALKRQGWEASLYFREVQRAQNALAAAMVEFARREQGLTPDAAESAVGGLLQGDNFFEGMTAPEMMGPNQVKETQARFARPDQNERLYEKRQDTAVRGHAEAWLDDRTLASAIDALASDGLPAGIPSEDVRQQVIGQALMRATAAMQRGDEFARTQARVLANKAARLYQNAGRESARAMRQRAVVNAELVPIAPVLAAESLLIDRADAVMGKRFEGGAEGGAAKVDAAAKRSGKTGGEELAKKLERRVNGRKREEADEATVRERAERRASQLIYGVEERLRQGSKDLKKTGTGADTINRAFREQVTDPLPWAQFAVRMVKLNVGQEVAARLFQTAQREAQDQAAMAIYRAEKARRERAERTASQLIYRTEERLRQGSRDMERAANGDSINQAFRDQVESPLEAGAFRARLLTLGVPDWLSDRLFNTAQREANDQAKMRQFESEQAARELAKDESALARMLNQLRGKMFPGMSWQAIFEELPSQQRERQREIYTRLRKDERLRNLTSAELVGLTNELDKAWQRERRKVFLRELEKAGALGEKDTSDRQKVQKTMPKLLRAINLGLMTSETFREAVATEYGLKMISGADAAKLRTLAEEAYQAPEGVLRSRKLADLLAGIQKSTGTSRAEALNSYWVAAILSGSRTMFDTFMSVGNGLGNQFIQSAMLTMKGGVRGAAWKSMSEWWGGLIQAFPESMQILAKGDYSYLKRFNDDLRKALDGESTFRPVPLGEALWKDGNWIEKWGMAPVMIWTGRLMAAADHLNNTATTAGARVVAQALHPEFYTQAGPSAADKTAARDQAMREVTGGMPPRTAQERATVNARTREILAGMLRTEEQTEANFMGDQAAYQNDPVGLFGAVYQGVSGGLGILERSIQAAAEQINHTGPAGHYARGIMLFGAGALRSMTGSKFIRFGSNFGNDLLGFVPGTYLAKPFILGGDPSASQKQLLLGKNLFGLIAALSVAAMFLGKEDEEEGWHIEGPWADLSPEEVKMRRAAGFEPFTFWKRDQGKIARVSYKQWPTSGLLAGVAHLQDRRRFAPEKWEMEGMSGHLLAAATVGLFQVKEASAVRGLAELLGASKFGANPEDDFVDKMMKLPMNFAGGFIPTLAKDMDLLTDPQRYKPEGTYEEFIRSVPLVRRSVAGGRPELNILGVPILQDRKPWSRTYTQAEHGVASTRLAKLMTRGLSLSVPDTGRKIWTDGGWTTVAALGAEAEWDYQKWVGQGYAAFLESRPDLMTLSDDAIRATLSRAAETIKMQALFRLQEKY